MTPPPEPMMERLNDSKGPLFKVVLSVALALLSGVSGISPRAAGIPSQSGESQTSTPPVSTTPVGPVVKADSQFRHAPPSDAELDRMLKEGFAAEVRVDRVLVPAVVTDRKGRPVQGLQAKNFLVTEDRVPQKIDFFHVDREENISIAFLMDVSGSMRLEDKIGEAREAIRYFLDGLGPYDQASVMTFADDQVDTLAPFGSSPALILARLDAVKAYGQTALNDAIAAAPGIVDKERVGRKAIVLITDGLDNFSKLPLFDAMSAARRVDVPIYAVGFAEESKAVGVPPAGEGTNAEILKMIADETGGSFFLIHDPDEMKEAIRSIEEDLRSQYLLGYTPSKTQCDGSFRRIELKVDKERFRVKTRKGYFSGPC